MTRTIVYITTSLNMGGAEKMLVDMATASAGQWDRTVVISLQDGNFANVSRLMAGHVEVHFWKVDGLFSALRALRKTVRLVRRLRPRIIQGWMYHGSLLATVALMLSGRRRSTKLVWAVRCSDMDTAFYNQQLKRVIGLCAWLSRHPDAIVYNAQAGEDVHRRLGFEPRQALVVANGVRLDEFRPNLVARKQVRKSLGIDEKAVVIGLVARVDPMKDHGNFYDAFRCVQGAHALLVGQGTQDLPDQTNVHRLGLRNDVHDVLAACDIAVSSSAFGEGFSNALAEGMAAGCAVVATDVGGARELIGDAGIIVPPREPQVLAAALQSLIDDRARMRTLGEAARERVTGSYPSSKMIDRFHQIQSEGLPV